MYVLICIANMCAKGQTNLCSTCVATNLVPRPASYPVIIFGMKLRNLLIYSIEIRCISHSIPCFCRKKWWDHTLKIAPSLGSWLPWLGTSLRCRWTSWLAGVSGLWNLWNRLLSWTNGLYKFCNYWIHYHIYYNNNNNSSNSNSNNKNNNNNNNHTHRPRGLPEPRIA